MAFGSCVGAAVATDVDVVVERPEEVTDDERRRGAFEVKLYMGGRPYYAYVRVAVVTRASEPRVALTLEPHDRGSIRPGSEPEYVRAMVDGATRGLDLLPAGVCLSTAWGPTSCRAQMLLVDLTESAFGAAGTLAVADALGVLDRMGIVDDDGCARPRCGCGARVRWSTAYCVTTRTTGT